MPALTQNQISQILASLSTNEMPPSNMCPSTRWLAALQSASKEAFEGGWNYSDAFALVFGYQTEFAAALQMQLPPPAMDPFTARVYELYANPDS